MGSAEEHISNTLYDTTSREKEYLGTRNYLSKLVHQGNNNEEAPDAVPLDLSGAVNTMQNKRYRSIQPNISANYERQPSLELLHQRNQPPLISERNYLKPKSADADTSFRASFLNKIRKINSTRYENCNQIGFHQSGVDRMSVKHMYKSPLLNQIFNKQKDDFYQSHNHNQSNCSNHSNDQDQPQKRVHENVYLIQPKSDLGMSGGRIIVRSQQPNQPQTIVDWNLLHLSAECNNNEQKQENRVHNNDKNPADTGKVIKMNKGSFEESHSCRSSLAKLDNVNTDSVPIDLSFHQNKFDHQQAESTYVINSGVMIQNKEMINQKRNSSEAIGNTYQVDEGIQPLCLMRSSDEDDNEDPETDQSMCLSRPHSLASTSGESTSSSLTDSTSAILSGDNIGISSPARYRTMGWKGQRLYPCRNCGAVFENAYGFSRHVDMECEGKTNEGHNSLNIAMEENDLNSPYNETVLEVQQSSQEKRDRGLHICNICNATYKARGALGCHIARVHSNSGKRKTVQNKDHMPVCPVCGDWFTTIQRFRSHLKVHKEWDLSTYIYSCTICGGRYTQEDQLERHIKRVHYNTNVAKHTRQPYDKFVLHPQDEESSS